MDILQQILVHTVKTINYRFIKVINGSKENFGEFKISDHTRTPNQIINHMFDLAAKTRTFIMEGHFNIMSPALLDFDSEKERLIAELKELSTVIETISFDMDTGKKLLQGPLADIITHIGQLAMLNGLNGNKIPKESYYNAVVG